MTIDVDTTKEQIDKLLGEIVQDYNDLKSMFEYDPLIVSLLPEGAFSAYMQAQVEAGADLAHIKPPHMQPSDKITKRLKMIKD